MYDLANFSETNMYNFAIALRNAGSGARSMEEVANRMVSFIYKNCLDGRTGKPACVLVRAFKTHLYGNLTRELQESAHDMLKGVPIENTTKCLTLLATAGDEPQWNFRKGSTGHKAIPLIDEAFVKRAPMISQLLHQFGLEISAVIEPMPNLLVESEHKIQGTSIFHVPNALGSHHIPAQQEFVVRYGVQSVLGFGGLLPTEDLFAIIMFTRTQIPQETASLFKWVSAYSYMAAAAFDGEAVFDTRVPARRMR